MSARRRRKQKQNKGISFIAFIVVAFCLVVGVKTASLKKESQQLAKEKNKLETEIKEEKNRTKTLEELEKYMQTKKYQEEVARERLGLVYPDEILIEPSNK